MYSKMYAANSQKYKINESLFIQCQEYLLVSSEDENKYQVKQLVMSYLNNKGIQEHKH